MDKKDHIKVAALLEDGVPVTVANGWRGAKWFIFGGRQLHGKLCLIRQTLNGAESLQSRYLSTPQRKQQGFMSRPPPVAVFLQSFN